MGACVNRRPTREEAVEMRLAEMYDAFTSGQSEDTGKLVYDYVDPSGWDRGAVVGRIPGVKPAFPESMLLSEGPGRIAKAIREKKGVTYDRILQAVRGWADRQDLEPTRAAKTVTPTVPAHSGRASCRHCGAFHTTGQHRFHGKGAFHRTHLFSFPTMRNPYKPHVEFKPTVKQAEDIVWYARKYGVAGMDRDLLAKARAKLRQVRKPVSNPREKWERFRDLPTGARFIFSSEVLYPTSGIARGPWIKTGARTYRHESGSYGPLKKDLEFKVGSINAQVRQVTATNPRRRATARRAKANPPGQVIGYVEKLFYRRTVGKHRGYYQHTFKTRAEVVAMPNGTVLLRPAK